MNSYDKNIFLKIELIHFIDKLIELRETQMKIMEEIDEKIQNDIKVLSVKSKM